MHAVAVTPGGPRRACALRCAQQRRRGRSGRHRPDAAERPLGIAESARAPGVGTDRNAAPRTSSSRCWLCNRSSTSRARSRTACALALKRHRVLPRVAHERQSGQSRARTSARYVHVGAVVEELVAHELGQHSLSFLCVYARAVLVIEMQRRGAAAGERRVPAAETAAARV
jgi:hypothetical protein